MQQLKIYILFYLFLLFFFFFDFKQESVNSFIFFMLNTMGQDCKDEKLSQQTASQGIRKILP